MHKIIDGRVIPSKLDGHYSSTYVCVVKIDDGRIYVDYHIGNSKDKYGSGRVLNKIYIDGVTTNKGVWISGSIARLEIIAIYLCDSKEEAIEVFELVLKEYKEKYGKLVFYNKKSSTDIPEKRVIPPNEIVLPDKIRYKIRIGENEYTEELDGLECEDVFPDAYSTLPYYIKPDVVFRKPSYRNGDGFQLFVDFSFSVFKPITLCISIRIPKDESPFSYMNRHITFITTKGIRPFNYDECTFENHLQYTTISYSLTMLFGYKIISEYDSIFSNEAFSVTVGKKEYKPFKESLFVSRNVAHLAHKFSDLYISKYGEVPFVEPKLSKSGLVIRNAPQSFLDLANLISFESLDVIKSYILSTSFSDLDPYLTNHKNPITTSQTGKVCGNSLSFKYSLYDISYDYAGIDFRVDYYISGKSNEILQDYECTLKLNSRNYEVNIQCHSYESSNYSRLMIVFLDQQEDFFLSLIKVLSDDDFSCNIGKETLYMADNIKNALVLYCWYRLIFKKRLIKKRNIEANNWQKEKRLDSFRWGMYERRKGVRFISVDKINKKAKVDGSMGIYDTTMTSCTCVNFQDRAFFAPCKHMYALADKLGYFSLFGSPKLDLSLDEDSPDKELKLLMVSGKNSHISHNVEVGEVPSWKYPFIKVSSGKVELYIGREYGFIHAEYVILPDISVYLYLDGEISGTVYEDDNPAIGSFMYRISSIGDHALLDRLERYGKVTIELKRKKDGFVIFSTDITKVSGIGRMYTELYLTDELAK